MSEVTVIVSVRAEAAADLARSVLSVAGQTSSSWQATVVHGGHPDLMAAAADLAAGDPRIAGADDVETALASSSAPIVAFLQSGARYPSDYLQRIGSAFADRAVRVTVAARIVEHGPRFSLRTQVAPDGEPELSQVAVRREDAALPLAALLAGPGRLDLPAVAVSTRFGRVPDPLAGRTVTAVVELDGSSPPLSVKPQLAELTAAGIPVVVALAGPARLAGRAALGRWLQQRGIRVLAASSPGAARAAAIASVGTPLVAFLPAGWEIDAATIDAAAALVRSGDAAAVAPVARDAGGSILGAGLIWADDRSLPQRFLRGHAFADAAHRIIEVPAPHPEGLVVRTEDAAAAGDAAAVPAPWWPVLLLGRAARSGPVLIDGRGDIAVPRFTPPTAADRTRWAGRPLTPAQRGAIVRAAPHGAVAASRAAVAGLGWSVAGVAPDAGHRWLALLHRPPTTTAPVATRRWALKIGAPAGRRGASWGDVFFADDLAAALRSLGNDVVIDRDGSAGRTAAYLDRVVLNLRGYQVVQRQPGTVHLLWVISHPDLLTADEMRSYDRVYAASALWPRTIAAQHGIPVQTLLQATNPDRFHPDVAAPDTGPDLLFVGNSKHQFRPIVADCRAAGLRPTVIGGDWEKFLPAEEIAAVSLPNDELPGAYRSAGIVLNDHWGDMAEHGFLNNRLFDAVACGARVVTDEVAGLGEVFGDAVKVYRTAQDLARLCDPAQRGQFGTESQRRERAAAVAAEHSFVARARRLMADAAAFPILAD